MKLKPNQKYAYGINCGIPIKELIGDLRVHSISNSDFDTADQCDRLLSILRTQPKSNHQEILDKWKGKILPQCNTVYQLAPKYSPSRTFNGVSRHSKRVVISELDNK
jgi:hypothetical protein